MRVDGDYRSARSGRGDRGAAAASAPQTTDEVSELRPRPGEDRWRARRATTWWSSGWARQAFRVPSPTPTRRRPRGRALRIAVLERSPREERGGSTRYTGSWFRVTEERGVRSELRREMMESVSGGLADLLDYHRRRIKTLERELPADRLPGGSRRRLHLLQAGAPEPQHRRRLGMPAGNGLGISTGRGDLEQTTASSWIYAGGGFRTLSEEGRVEEMSCAEATDCCARSRLRRS